MSLDERPTLAVVISLVAGILILLGSSMWYFWWGVGWDIGYMMRWSGMMNWGLGRIGLTMGVAGIVFGLLIIAGAVMLYVSPKEHNTWGIIILVFSVLSVISCMGGFVVGLILGVVGGILAITWRPSKPSQDDVSQFPLFL